MENLVDFVELQISTGVLSGKGIFDNIRVETLNGSEPAFVTWKYSTDASQEIIDIMIYSVSEARNLGLLF